MIQRQISLLVVLVLACALPAHSAQRDDLAYSLDAGSGWERFEYKDGATIQRVEYIYGDRQDAVLKVKRERLSPGESLDQAVEDDANRSLRFQPGFLRGRTERVGGGTLDGIMIEYDYTRGGKPMLGRYYYLMGEGGTVWVLQFTGDRTILKQIRNLTDRMARSFRSS